MFDDLICEVCGDDFDPDVGCLHSGHQLCPCCPPCAECRDAMNDDDYRRD